MNNRVKRNQDFVRQYKKDHPCTDCGEENIVLLEFFHARGEKKHYISEMVWRNHALDVIKEEIAKCDVVCIKCERIRSAKRDQYYAHMNAKVLSKNQKTKLKKLNLVREKLQGKSCKCSESNPLFIDFEFNNSMSKYKNISDIVRHGSMTDLVTEIEKCEVICCNCHRIKIANEKEFYTTK